MRIAHVTDCYLPRLGGIELQVHDLASRQRAMGHEVSVVTSVTSDPGTRAVVNGHEDFDDARVGSIGSGVLVHRPTERGARGGHGVIRYAHSWSGRSVVLRGKYDVVHVHASTFSPLAFLTAHAASRAGIPTAVTLHSLWSYATPLFRGANRLCSWADWPVAWSAVSSVAAEPLRQVLRDRAAVAVLPNGVEPAQWLSGPVASSAAAVRLVSVMRLARRKRPRDLLAILRQVAQEVGTSVRLSAEIIGDGPQRPLLERYLRRHDMNGWVTLAGRRSRAQIRQALGQADLFVTASTLESFGIAALEARTAGLPVVARAGTGVEDFIAHRREGILVASDAEMVGAIVELVTSPAARAAMATHNRSVAPAPTWDDVLARCDALYDAALTSQKAIHATVCRRLADSGEARPIESHTREGARQ
ncbi:MAG: glycosyltransferase family 4 protein [Acidothermaceae bacterium]